MKCSRSIILTCLILGEIWMITNCIYESIAHCFLKKNFARFVPIMVMNHTLLNLHNLMVYEHLNILLIHFCCTYLITAKERHLPYTPEAHMDRDRNLHPA